MNTVNRVVVVALLVTVGMLCCVLLVGSRWVVPALAKQLVELGDSLRGLRWYQLEIPGIALALAMTVILAFLVILEVRRPRARFIRVEKAAGGEVQVSVASIVDRLKHEIDALPGVLGVKPRVTSRRGGVAIHLQVDIAAGLDVPVQAGQIVETARLVVEDRMGLKMARVPKVSLRAVPYPKMVKPGERMSVERPPEPPPPIKASVAPIALEELPPGPLDDDSSK
jgi:hypothetical protein